MWSCADNEATGIERAKVLIHVDLSNGLARKGTEFEPTTFKKLGLKEADIEEFIRNSIEVLFISENAQEASDESLLIVGQQVLNVQKGRSDLTAVDGNGHLTLIEIKRDVEDIGHRKEALEFQAIRYAASLATVKTPEQLVELVYAPYVEKHRQKKSLVNSATLPPTRSPGESLTIS